MKIIRSCYDRSRGPSSIIALLCLALTGHAAALKTENVFLIISDGFRWQEVFTGAEEALMTAENGVKDRPALRARYWRETPEGRRQALLPFIWTEIALHGQLLGNQSKGSVVVVTNGKKFSYPGYNEIITGAPDPRIDSNGKHPNPNVSVFEWLNARAEFRGKVDILGTWDVFPYIFNIARSQLPIWPAWEPQFARYEIHPPAYVTALMRDTTPGWEDLTYDSFLAHAAEDCLKKRHPRVAFFGFGETDEWAHAGRYDNYLDSAHRVDDFVRRLWSEAQAMPQYRGKTTIILTADHGRGSGPVDWKSHGETTAGSEGDWIAVLGPDTPPLGERSDLETHTQSQIAATIAALLGQDYQKAFPNAGAPIKDLIRGANP